MNHFNGDYLIFMDAISNQTILTILTPLSHTYGTASAPYLTTRALRDIADKCKNYENGKININDFYMDDLMTGTNSVESATYIMEQISSKFMKANLN